MLLVVDRREAEAVPDVVKSLEKVLPVKVDTLESGDYYIPSPEKGIVVERKTVYDLLGSIRDRRLWDQLQRLVSVENAFPALLLEGSLSMTQKYSQWSEPAIVAALFSIVWDWKVPVLHAPTRRWTVIYLAQMTKRFLKVKEGGLYPLRVKPKTLGLDDSARMIVEGLPHFGPALADRVLRQFGTVDNLMGNLAYLDSVPGVGKKIQGDVLKVVSHVYGGEGDDGG